MLTIIEYTEISNAGFLIEIAPIKYVPMLSTVNSIHIDIVNGSP